MGTRTLTIFLFAVFLLTALLQAVEAQTKPWLQSFTAVRARYVSTNGTGQGTLSSNPMSLSNAINSAQPGDLYWLAGGTYNGTINLSRSGTSTKPIVFRATPNQRVIINGSVDILGSYVWVWGLEISDLNKHSSVDSGVRLLAPGVHLINNVIHHAKGNGIGAWQHGPGHVIYGNIVYQNGPPGHNIYGQNDFVKDGYKYIVDNMWLDQSMVCDDCLIFNLYATNAKVTGFHVERNIFRNQKFNVGGYGVPADRHVIKNNYFYNVGVRIGWRRPTQVQFLNNYLARSDLISQYFWGTGETIYNQTAPNVYTGNEIILPIQQRHIRLQTSAYMATGRCEGCPKIQTTDTVNNNKFAPSFRGWLNANNTFNYDLKLSEWRTATAAAGKALDMNSVEIPVPTTPKVVLLKNDYDPTRGHLVIFNWGKIPNVTVDLSSVLPVGSAYKIYDAKSYLLTPLKSGTYTAPVALSTGSQEFVALVVQKL